MDLRALGFCGDGSCNLVIRVLCEVQPSMNCKCADDKVIACLSPDACSLSQPIAERQTTSGHYAAAVPVFEPPRTWKKSAKWNSGFTCEGFRHRWCCKANPQRRERSHEKLFTSWTTTMQAQFVERATAHGMWNVACVALNRRMTNIGHATCHYVMRGKSVPPCPPPSLSNDWSLEPYKS